MADTTSPPRIESHLTAAEQAEALAWLDGIGGPEWRLQRFYDGRVSLVHRDFKPQDWIGGP